MFPTRDINNVQPLSSQAPYNSKPRKERTGVHMLSTEQVQAAEDLFVSWQQHWSAVSTRIWTRTLIPDVHWWVKRGHGETYLFLPQFFTGHIAFMSYLF